MQKKPDDLQDIYRAEQGPAAKPEPVFEMPEELELQLRRYQILFAVSALLVVVLLFILAAMLLRAHRIKPAAPLSLSLAEQQYVPHYTLPSDDLWVMSYEQAAGNLALIGKQGDMPVSTKWIKNAAYNMIVGQQALTVGQFEKAAAHFEKALMIFPEIRGVRGALGTVYLKQQKFEAAIDQLKGALGEEQDSFPAASNLGAALLAAERFDEAEGYLLQALALRPDHPGCHKNLALLYQKMELPEKALPYFETYFSLYLDDLDMIGIYADYLISLGQPERAMAFLREVCRQQSADALPLYLLLANLEARSTNAVATVDALKNITRYISPNLALIELHREEFDTIRDTEAFQTLLHQLEIAMVTLENQN